MNYEEYVKEIFPEVDEIEDDALRQKVIKAWAFAIEKGGWNSIDDIPFTLMVPDVKETFVEHTRRVTQMAIAIANVRKDVKMDYIIAGGLTHDLGKVLEFTKKDGRIVKSEFGKIIRHPVSGAWIALQFDFPAEVAHIISAHSKEGDMVSRTPEAIIIHHCDFIDFDIVKSKK